MWTMSNSGQRARPCCPCSELVILNRGALIHWQLDPHLVARLKEMSTGDRCNLSAGESLVVCKHPRSTWFCSVVAGVPLFKLNLWNCRNSEEAFEMKNETRVYVHSKKQGSQKSHSSEPSWSLSSPSFSVDPVCHEASSSLSEGKSHSQTLVFSPWVSLSVHLQPRVWGRRGNIGGWQRSEGKMS